MVFQITANAKCSMYAMTRIIKAIFIFFTSFLCSNNFVESRRMLLKSLHFLDKCGTILHFFHLFSM
nr:MAG TPA: hypothetical protein [Caudoviricetes sp.]